MRVFISILLSLMLLSQAKAFSTFSSDLNFLDYENLVGLFKKNRKQVVHIINLSHAPIKIVKAEVSDKGTVFFSDHKGVLHSFFAQVENTTKRKILSYEITWTLKHPFQDYVIAKITANSINPLKPKDKQVIEFKKDKYFRDDAYYYAQITKVQFDDDESVWEAPLSDTNATTYENIKKEIDHIDDEKLNKLDELLEKIKPKGSEQKSVEPAQKQPDVTIE